MSAALCAIALHEEPYLDEWIRYHAHVGFRPIIVYDNSANENLKDWPLKYPPGLLIVMHLPGRCMQTAAYNHCLAQLRRGAFGAVKWCAFFDVDEFLVLRAMQTGTDAKEANASTCSNTKASTNANAHVATNTDATASAANATTPPVVALLQQYCAAGGLAVNWLVFGSNGQTHYQPQPVVQRFTRRGRDVNQHVKSIVCVIDAVKAVTPHSFELREGKRTRDTSGNPVDGPFNPGGPTNVAVLHHYFLKSRDEFAQKIARGRADIPVMRTMDEFAAHDDNDVEDTSAYDIWRRVPPD